MRQIKMIDQTEQCEAPFNSARTVRAGGARASDAAFLEVSNPGKSPITPWTRISERSERPRGGDAQTGNGFSLLFGEGSVSLPPPLPGYPGGDSGICPRAVAAVNASPHWVGQIRPFRGDVEHILANAPERPSSGDSTSPAGLLARWRRATDRGRRFARSAYLDPRAREAGRSPCGARLSGTAGPIPAPATLFLSAAKSEFKRSTYTERHGTVSAGAGAWKTRLGAPVAGATQAQAPGSRVILQEPRNDNPSMRAAGSAESRRYLGRDAGTVGTALGTPRVGVAGKLRSASREMSDLQQSRVACDPICAPAGQLARSEEATTCHRPASARSHQGELDRSDSAPAPNRRRGSILCNAWARPCPTSVRKEVIDMAWRKSVVRDQSGRTVRRDYTSQPLGKTVHYSVDSAGGTRYIGYTRHSSIGRPVSYDRYGKRK